MKNPVCIIGGGVAGMQVALVLSSLGTPSVLVEKSSALGGRVPRLSRTFPFFNDDGFYDGKEFTDTIERDLRSTSLVDVRCGATISALRGDFPNFTVELADGSSFAAGAVVVATGFTPFNPTSLPEYGYGIYPNVITATELEWITHPAKRQ
jgi:heterodisulfide reductase subunit A